MVDIVCTLGPSCDNIEILNMMKSKGMTFARVNMSHAQLPYVKKIIELCKQVNIPLILDTEGAQVRTGELDKAVLVFDEGDIVNVYGDGRIGSGNDISLWPSEAVYRLKLGDMISIDFDTLLLKAALPLLSTKHCVSSGQWP